MFWENQEQANDRLNNTLVNFEGSPVFIEEITDNGRTIEAFVRKANDPGLIVSVDLEDEGWNDFRSLPCVGLINTPSFCSN